MSGDSIQVWVILQSKRQPRPIGAAVKGQSGLYLIMTCHLRCFYFVTNAPQSIMIQFLHRCQQFSHAPVLASLQAVLITLAICGLSGCWQEIRYEPSRVAQYESSQRVEPATEMTRPQTAPLDREIEPEGTPAESQTMPELNGTVNDSFKDIGVEGTNDIPQTPTPAEQEVVMQEDLVATQPSEPEGDTLDLPAPSAEPEPTSLPSAQTRRAAWNLSSEWSMAAALLAKGRDRDSFGERIDRAADEAEFLGISLPALPSSDEPTDRVERALQFLLDDAGPEIAGSLKQQYGTDHAALAELATKTHVLLLSYSPKSTSLEPVIDSIRQAAENSDLPDNVWRGLIDLLTERADFKAVKSAIFQLHRDAAAQLAESR